jgi:hypothetical protein
MPDPIVPAETPPAPATEPQTPPVTPAPVPPKMIEEDKYKAAVREMNIKQQESALLRKELDLMKQQISGMVPIQQQQSPKVASEEIRNQLEARYNGKVPFELLQAINDIQDLKMGAVNKLQEKIDNLDNMLLEEKYENTKSRLKADDPIFDDYMPEVEAKLNLLPLRQRTNKEEIARVKQEVIGSHLMEIVQKARESGIQSVTARPPAPPEVNSPGGGTPITSNTKVTRLTAEQKAFIERSGGDAQATEEYLNGKKKSSSRWGNYAE